MIRHRLIRRFLVGAAALSCLLLNACGSPLSRTNDGAGPPGDEHPRPMDRALRELIFEEDRVYLARPEGLSPTSAESVAQLLRRADTELYAGRWSVALEKLTLALAAAPQSADVYTALGKALRKARHPLKAEPAFRHALSLDPDHAESLYELGLLEQAAGRREDAVDTWRELVLRHPDHAKAHRRLAAAFYLEANPEAARDHLQRAASHAVPAHLEAALAGVSSTSRTPRTRGTTTPVVGPEIRIDSGPLYSSEPTIEVGPVPGHLIASWFDTPQDATEAHVVIGQSFDDGQTWETFQVESPEEVRTTAEGDGIVAVDRSTGNVWVSGLSVGGGVWVAHRPPLATEFEEPVVVTSDRDADKPMMTLTEDALFHNLRRLYVFHNLGAQVSLDMGATWSVPVPLGGFLGYHPAVDSSDRVFAVYADDSGDIRLIAGRRGRLEFEGPFAVAERVDFWDAFGGNGSRFPGRFRVVAFPVLAIDPRDDTMYSAFIDTTDVTAGQTNVDVYFTRSTDGGQTWSTPTILNGDGSPTGDQFFPWLHVDATGRLHAVYYDTRHGGDLDGAPSALLDTYYAYSEDRGDTWTEIRLTPQSFSSSAAWFPDVPFVGDYIGVTSRTVGGATRAYAIYMSTAGGDSDIFLRKIDFGDVDGGGNATCIPDETSLCLLDERFRVSLDWEDFQGQTGSGMARGLTSDTGYFWFFNRDNVEVTVKVLDGCGFSGKYWVFAAGMTNVSVRLSVEDTVAGDVRTYVNPLGDPFQPVQDTSAFDTCATP